MVQHKNSTFLQKAVEKLQDPLYPGLILMGITLLITMQNLLLGNKINDNGFVYTHYNNYLIFKDSYFHLVGHLDLYTLYPGEHWDYFKYSPTFALFMAPFAWLPDLAGLFLWNALNSMILFIALWKLPLQSNKIKLYIVGFILIELITSLQNSQSNALVAGLIILSFVLLERKQLALASLLIVFSIFIKIFGIVAIALFLFYPHKFKAIIYTIVWGLLLAMIPLVAVPASQLVYLYHSWVDLLKNDQSISYGLSVAGWLYSWFHTGNIKNLILFSGLILLGLPLLRFRLYREMRFRLLYLSSILIWVVIFNHKAESPTFIIAMTGVAIWYFTSEKNIGNTILLILAFILASLSPTDLFPRNIRNTVIVPYVLKAVPCILVWVKINYDLLFFRPDKKELLYPGSSETPD